MSIRSLLELDERSETAEANEMPTDEAIVEAVRRPTEEEDEQGEADEVEVEKDANPAELLEMCRKLQAAAQHRSNCSDGESWDQNRDLTSPSNARLAQGRHGSAAASESVSRWLLPQRQKSRRRTIKFQSDCPVSPLGIVPNRSSD